MNVRQAIREFDVRQAIREFNFREMLRRPETRIGSALLVIVAGIWGFAEIAEEVSEQETASFDEAVMLAMRQGPENVEMIGPAWVEKFATDLTALGGYPVVLLLTLIVLGYLCLSRHFIRAVEIALAVAGGAVVMMALKDFFARPRPEVVPPMYEVASWSFPSGHSSTAAVVYLTLGILLARFITQRILTLYVLATAFFLILVVGWTRVALGVHYPTDVLAGWAVGIAWALFSWLVIHLWENWRGRGERARREAEMYENTEAEVAHHPRGSEEPISSDMKEQPS
jgi:undecaprenyl-diphosphatase